jgi:hypothetical protein
MAADIITLRLFNVDDVMSAYISNTSFDEQLILQADFQQDTGFVDITGFLRPGSNNILLTDFNVGGTWSYGFDLKDNGVTIDSGSCGVAGVSGCNGDDRTVGLVFSEDPQPGNGGAIPEPETWMLVMLGFGAAGSGLRRSRRWPGAASA